MTKQLDQIIGQKITKAHYSDAPFNFTLETENGVRVIFNGIPLNKKRNISTESKNSLRADLINKIKLRHSANYQRNYEINYRLCLIEDVRILRDIATYSSIYKSLFRKKDFYISGHFNDHAYLTLSAAKKWVEENLHAMPNLSA